MGAQPSAIQPSHLTTDPPQVKPSFPELPIPAKSVQRQPQEQSDQINGAKKPFIEPFFPILPPATISPDGARSELEARQDERQRRRTEGLLGGGAGTRIEGVRPSLKA